MTFTALETPGTATVKGAPPGRFWAFALVLLPLLNFPLAAAFSNVAGQGGLVLLAILELAAIGWYLRRKGFGAGWAVLAGVLSIAITVGLLIAALLLALTYGCDGDPCLS